MKASSQKDGTEALRELGFTEMEADVYMALLQVAPATGYRLAQQVGKAVANVYKALESLQNKGAVLIDDSESRLCRPVPWEDLLRHFESQFNTAKSRAAQALAGLERSGNDERLYQLRSREQVMERARSLLRRGQGDGPCRPLPWPGRRASGRARSSSASWLSRVCTGLSADRLLRRNRSLHQTARRAPAEDLARPVAKSCR